MTKEEWIHVKKQPYIPLGVWFSYYKERGGIIEDAMEFEQYFNKIMRDTPIYVRHGSVRHITPETAKYNLFSYYDSIFDL